MAFQEDFLAWQADLQTYLNDLENSGHFSSAWTDPISLSSGATPALRNFPTGTAGKYNDHQKALSPEEFLAGYNSKKDMSP